MSFTTVIGNATVNWPGGSVMLAGTCTAVVSLETRLTVTGPEATVPSEMVPVTPFAPSATEAGAVRESGRISLSRTRMGKAVGSCPVAAPET